MIQLHSRSKRRLIDFICSYFQLRSHLTGMCNPASGNVCRRYVQKFKWNIEDIFNFSEHENLKNDEAFS